MRTLLGLVLAALPAALFASAPHPDVCPPGHMLFPISSAPGNVTITEDIATRGTVCAPAPPPITPATAGYTRPTPPRRDPTPDVDEGELRLVSLNPPSPTAIAQQTSSRVIVRTYDDFDRVKSELVPLEDGTSAQIRYTYWRDGLRKTMTDMVGRVTYYEYDGQARLSRVTANQGLPNQHVTSYTYWPDDLLKTTTAPNGLLTSYDYDLADRVTSIIVSRDAVPLLSYAYTYDANGNRLSQTETNGDLPELTTYTYDARDRLTSVKYPAGSSVEYGYDEVGNRTSEIERNADGNVVSSKAAVFDALNRLSLVTDAETHSTIATFTYDANGNLTSKTTASGTETYDYDQRDLMVEARNGTDIVARYAYDAFGRRYLKVSSEGPFASVVRQYLYDQTSVLHELDSDDLEVAKYEYGGDRLLSLTRRDEERRFYHQDALGSVVALSDNAGTLVTRYHLDAWGRYRSPDELTHSKNRFGFTGYLFDQETKLYYAKARFYDPEYGRFTSQDSVLGEIDAPPSLHRYFYGYANPLRYVDPTGHQTVGAEYCRAYACAPHVQRNLDPVFAATQKADAAVNTVGGAAANAAVLIFQETLGNPGHNLTPEGRADWEAVVPKPRSDAEAVLTAGFYFGFQLAPVGTRALRSSPVDHVSELSFAARVTVLESPTQLPTSSPLLGGSAIDMVQDSAGTFVATLDEAGTGVAPSLPRGTRPGAILAEPQRGPFYAGKEGTASRAVLEKLAQARQASETKQGSHKIGTDGEEFLSEMLGGAGGKHTQRVGSQTRFVDRRVEGVNFEVKNTARRQSSSSFFRAQLLKESQMLSTGTANRSVLVGTRGFSAGAAAQATAAGVEVIDLSAYPDVRDLPR